MGGFITLEGGEGTGKSTQARRLVDRLLGLGHDAVATREPGGSGRAELIRDALLSGQIAPLGPVAEAMMFSAGRLDHLDETIRPALARGAFVVCDRFTDSTRVYQGALGKVDAGLLAGLERLVVGTTRPELTLVLDLDVGTGLARARARRGGRITADRFEREGEAFHEALRYAYLKNAAAEPDRCVVLDASRGADDVADAIWKATEAKFPHLATSP